MPLPPRRNLFFPGTAPRKDTEHKPVEIAEFRGVDSAQPAVDLPPGVSPDASNFIPEHSFLRPRSGLSQFGNAHLGANPGLLAWEQQAVDGTLTPVVASTTTISAFGITGAASWSTLSYVIRGTGLPADVPSGGTANAWHATGVYDPVADQLALVFSNGHNTPKKWIPSQTTYSDISDFISVDSVGKYPFALDDRLFFWHCANSVTTFATRLRYSERGLTSNFSTVGAGFIDIMDMRGEGTGAVTREFDAVLFSTDEIWAAIPRRDVFAVDVRPLSRAIGCPYPRTIAKTPIGIIFLSREFEHYIIVGSDVRSMGHGIHDEIKDTIVNPDVAFSLYNSREQRYEFYYQTSAAQNRCDRGFYFDTVNGGWYPISVAHELSAGYETAQSTSDDPILWDDYTTQTWDDIASTWAAQINPGAKGVAKDVMVVTSAGTVCRFRSEQTTDLGSAITAYWVSHAMPGDDRTRSKRLYNIWLDYESDAASGLSVSVRGHPKDAFGTAQSVTLPGELEGGSQRVNVMAVGRAPQVRIQTTDGTRPRIAGLVAKLKDAGQH